MATANLYVVPGSDSTQALHITIGAAKSLLVTIGGTGNARIARAEGKTLTATPNVTTDSLGVGGGSPVPIKSKVGINELAIYANASETALTAAISICDDGKNNI